MCIDLVESEMNTHDREFNVVSRLIITLMNWQYLILTVFICGWKEGESQYSVNQFGIVIVWGNL